MEIILPEITTDNINGLNIVHIKTKMTMVGLTIASRIGSYIETPSTYGWVHFLEHILFQGTNNKTAEDIQNISHDIGGYFNAFTGHYEMCLELDVPYYNTEVGMDLLFDCFFNPNFKKKNIDKERNVIFEEMSMSDSGLMAVKEQLMTTILGETELSHSILGTQESISKITAKKIEKFYNEIINLDNTFFVYIGPEDYSKVSKMIEGLSKYYKNTKVHGEECKYSDISLKTDASLIQVEIKRIINPIAAMYMGLPGYNSLDINLEVALDCVSGPTNSVLFNHLRDSKGLIYSLDSMSYFNPFYGILEISAPSSKPEEVLAHIIKIIEKTHRRGIDPSLIRSSKNQYKANFLRQLQTSDSIRQMVLTDIIFNNITNFEDKYQEFDSISDILVNEHFKTSFDLSKMVSVTYIPKVNKKKLLKELEKLK